MNEKEKENENSYSGYRKAKNVEYTYISILCMEK